MKKMYGYLEPCNVSIEAIQNGYIITGYLGKKRCCLNFGELVKELADALGLLQIGEKLKVLSSVDDHIKDIESAEKCVEYILSNDREQKDYEEQEAAGRENHIYAIAHKAIGERVLSADAVDVSANPAEDDEHQSFLRWLITHLKNASIEDLNNEPIDINERMAFLRKKYEEEK